LKTSISNKNTAFAFALAATCIPLAQATTIQPAGFAPVSSEEVVSSNLGEKKT